MPDPKILAIDIETFPNLIHAWGVWDQNSIKVERDWIICCFSAKWVGGSKQITKGLPDYPNYKPARFNDALLLDDVWHLLDEADIVVAHNGDDFDIKKLNARFLVKGWTAPSPYRTVDTKKVARRHFGFSSNKLNELCRQLDIGKKMDTGGFELWEGCMAGDTASWAKMKRYNAHDVKLLEELYLRMRPWTASHPNLGLYTGLSGCPKCGSDKLQSRGIAVNLTSICQRWHCQSCGAWSKSNNQRTKRTNVVNI